MGSLNNLGSNIAGLRKKSDITQDQLAEQLGVSVSAVSQWENGRTMPDISAIPVLCHIFNVTSDELLGIDREKDEEEIKRINAEANKLLDRAHYAKAEKLLLDAHRRFPNNYDLMVSLMSLYFNLSNPYEYDGSEQVKKQVEKSLQKSMSYAQKILEGCRDEESRSKANQILCFAYDSMGDTEKAIEIAKKMPTMSVCRESLLSTVSKNRSKYESIQTEYFILLQKLCVLLDTNNMQFSDGTYAYTAHEEAALAQKIIDILDVLFEDKDFGFFHDILMRADLHIARITARHDKDKEKVIACLKNAAIHAEAFLEHDEGKKHTSLFLRGSEYGTFRTSAEKNTTAYLLDVLKDDRFDFIRDDPEFIALTERLNKTAGNWK
ncbi:MAG: helix-turn-helix transcriptional regulator [Lachnospiraceae bacterium]|nr:helix-turn-helix transcriptional regulator [Lachnospiraceae bacterium]